MSTALAKERKRDTDKGNQRGKGFQCETEAHPTVSDSKYFWAVVVCCIFDSGMLLKAF